MADVLWERIPEMNKKKMKHNLTKTETLSQKRHRNLHFSLAYTGSIWLDNFWGGESWEEEMDQLAQMFGILGRSYLAGHH